MIYYVDIRAERDGNGSKERPFRHIDDAAKIAVAGDEVLVAPGVYREKVTPRNAGREDARIVYRSTEPLGAVITGAEVFVPLEDLVDFAAEIERLPKEKAKLEGEVARSEKMLSNPGFVNKAPEAKVQQEKDKMADYKEKLAKVTDRLAAIEGKA